MFYFENRIRQIRWKWLKQMGSTSVKYEHVHNTLKAVMMVNKKLFVIKVLILMKKSREKQQNQ